MAHVEDIDAPIEEELDRALALEIQKQGGRRHEVSPSDRQRIGSFTVACLVLNRTIGSGIFVVPRLVLLGTNSVGIALIFWTAGGIISLCGLLVWLAFGLNVPLRAVDGEHERSVPRSGGEKNYLEYLLRKPKFLATCMYGIPFLIVGNLAGNSVAFAEYCTRAAGRADADVARGLNIGIAVAALTVACLIHGFSRRFGIMLSNTLAVLKVLVLVAIFIIGILVGGGVRIGIGKSHSTNFRPDYAFASPQHDVSSYSFSFFYVLYSFSGFEQPFYVLSEVRRPRRIFPKATISAVALTVVLFVLVNIAYVCATPLTHDYLASGTDMATLFFEAIFGPGIAPRVISAFVALSIFGNIVVMTFTAARVKQEIAKEGILPFSLFFASGRTTPFAWMQMKLSNPRTDSSQLQNVTPTRIHLPEQAPVGGLLLHWVMSLALIAATEHLTSKTAYSALVFLYSYVLIALVGLFVSGGLVFLFARRSDVWRSSNTYIYRPWGGLWAAKTYALVSLFLVITAFLKPAHDSPFSPSMTNIPRFVLPAIGLSSLGWGIIWWGGLHLVMWFRDLDLLVTRLPHFELVKDGSNDEGEWVQRSEVISHRWRGRRYRAMADKGEEHPLSAL